METIRRVPDYWQNRSLPVLPQTEGSLALAAVSDHASIPHPDDHFSSTPLLQIVPKHNNHNENSREEKPWWLLPGTGFDVGLEVGTLYDTFAIYPDKNADVVFEEWVESRFKPNLNHFKWEYLRQELTFHYDLGVVEASSGPHLSSGDQLLISATTPKERNGAVSRSTQAVDSFLPFASPGSIALFTSPPGWTGLEDREGNMIEHTDTQTYVLKKIDERRYEAITIRTDMNIDENIRLLDSFGIPRSRFDRLWSDEEKVSRIVGTVVYLLPEEGPRRVEEIVERIQQAKESDIAYKNAPFERIYRNLQRREEFLAIDTVTESLAKRFTQYILERAGEGDGYEDIRQDIERAVGMTVLALMQAIKGEEAAEEKGDHAWINVSAKDRIAFFRYADHQYRQLLHQMQQLPGCAGGGQLSKGGMVSFDEMIPQYVDLITDDFIANSGGLHWWACDSCNTYKQIGKCNLCRECVVSGKYKKKAA